MNAGQGTSFLHGTRTSCLEEAPLASGQNGGNKLLIPGALAELCS